MSIDLHILSANRANLPKFGQPGDNYAQQLTIGRDAAFVALTKYVQNLSYDLSAAKSTLRDIGVWESRNHDALASVMADPASDALPNQIQLSLGQSKAAAFMIAVFTTAAAGLGPWQSGSVGQAASTGGPINTDWARVDAETRLQVFGGIVKMENDGQLSKFFVPAGTNGFGLPVPVLVAIVVAVVALASLVLVYLYAAKRLEQNNRLMRDLCEQAEKNGDKQTVSACLDASVNLQNQGFVPTSWVAIGAAAVAVVGVAYVGVKYAPWDILLKEKL